MANLRTKLGSSLINVEPVRALPTEPIAARHLWPSDIKVRASASAPTRKAVMAMQTSIHLGTYEPTDRNPSSGCGPEYETWFWLNKVIPSSVPLQFGNSEAARLRAAAHVARERGDDELAVQALDKAADEAARPKRGRPADRFRTLGGFGSFVIMLQMRRFKVAEIVDLIYAAEDDWSIAPTTRAALREQRWFGDADADNPLSTHEDSYGECRRRLSGVVEQLASRERKGWKIPAARGGNRQR